MAEPGTELSSIWDGLTTDKPLLSENQILPPVSETTDWPRFTPSVLSRPSALAILANIDCFYNTLYEFVAGNAQNVIGGRDPQPAVLVFCDSKYRSVKRLKCFAWYMHTAHHRCKARPSAVPIQRIPPESCRRQLTSSEGNPSWRYSFAISSATWH